MHAALPGRFATHVLRSPRYRGFLCEWAPAGVSKWSAVRHLAERWGIEAAGHLRRGRRRERYPHDSRRRAGHRDGQRPAGGESGRRPVAAAHDEEGVAQMVQWLLAKGESVKCKM